jgi:3-hydroxyisobutyrate dehydrogenase
VSSDSRIGLIGLGAMGWPMAANLVEAGIDLTVFDLDADRVGEFAAMHRCTSAAHPSDFAGVSILITMLPDGHVVADVIRNWEGGLLTVLEPGSTILDMSSSSPRGTTELLEDAQRHGLDVVDAPVSGGVPRATDATLSIMVGAGDESFAKVEPTLRQLGRAIFRTGPVGSGHAMKALNNVIAATAYAAVAEAIEVGRAYSLDSKTLIEVVNESTGRSFTSEVVFGQNVIPGTYSTGFALGLLAKDAGIAAEMATTVDIDAPVLQLVAERWSEALASVGFAADHSRAHTAWW